MLWEERIYGRELTVGVLGERALPAVEILPAEKDFDYAAKYQAGGARELCPGRPSHRSSRRPWETLPCICTILWDWKSIPGRTF